ncbi:MAG: US12 family protein [Thermoguttaceae bacterium]|nr:US12 family protein [Thermoguttaceae bacterium]
MEQNTYPYSLDDFESRAVAGPGSFLVKTYAHLFGAIVLFALLEAVLFTVFPTQVLGAISALGPKGTGLLILGLCFATSFISGLLLSRSQSRLAQYAALGLNVVLETLIFVPILAYAVLLTNNLGIALHAAVGTVLLTALLSVIVFMTRNNFSFLRPFLFFASIAALGLIVASLIFGFTLGTIFVYAMIALACCYILFSTGKVMDSYYEGGDGGYILAASELFVSVMMLFYYILIALLNRSR